MLLINGCNSTTICCPRKAKSTICDPVSWNIPSKHPCTAERFNETESYFR
ncbi:hypothetical protein BDFB_010310 [Asbolus verrucosus]|uniref:Uncharacterized protein n=1 Tax=Asbolus verrucosus TaxID=1661398 RepID=A0A482VSC8_ASBVE|nr:hypothetical protein BDFB_010310 [Asbolus verrucosus]